MQAFKCESYQSYNIIILCVRCCNMYNIVHMCFEADSVRG